MSMTSTSIRHVASTAALAVLAALPLRSIAAPWSITELANISNPVDINDHGTVLQGSQVIDGQNYYFTAINNLGQAVGNGPGGAYMYDKGILRRLDGLSYASDINDSGQVIGTSCPNNCALAKWENGVVSLPVGTSRYTEGYSINEVGQVLGFADTSYGFGNSYAAFTYDGASLTPIGLGGSHSYGRRINDHGVAVGESLTQLDFARHAFISDHGITRDLGTLGGWDSGAFDVNNLNDVVGRSQFSLLNNETHAFLYRGGTMIDLALLPEVTAAGWTTLYGATAINERGQIVGGGIRNGVYHAFLLQAAPVPEPETLALLLGGLALLCLRRQVRQPSDRPE